MTDQEIQTRQREIVIEHLVFALIGYVEGAHPGLLDHLERSLDHLGDPADDASKDDDAVRAIARKLIESAKRETAGRP